jgi:cation diffusion facilitator CzcD-associated flavoprotein CzcO
VGECPAFVHRRLRQQADVDCRRSIGRRCLSTEVVAAVPTAAGWELSTVDAVSGATDSVPVDYLVVANGIFSYPLVPSFAGADEHEAAGGRICHTSEIHDLDDVRGKHVVVVGYGKSACDLAAAISKVTPGTVMVARQLIWKMPKRPGGLNMKYLLLTRMGEGLFRYIRPRGMERILHGLGKPLRDGVMVGLQALVTRQLRLKQLGLVPQGAFEEIARSTVSLATEGFSEKVEQGAIVVHRDTVTERLGSDGGRPVAVLSSGDALPGDVIACGTGWQQRVPFFSQELERKLTDDRGNFELYHQIQPIDVPRLSFCGYNSSFFSPLSAEVAAWWIAAFLADGIKLPPTSKQRAAIQVQLRWMEQRTNRHHARGTNIIRSRCTTSTRCSRISGSTSARPRARSSGCCRSTLWLTGSCPPGSWPGQPDRHDKTRKRRIHWSRRRRCLPRRSSLPRTRARYTRRPTSTEIAVGMPAVQRCTLPVGRYERTGPAGGGVPGRSRMAAFPRARARDRDRCCPSPRIDPAARDPASRITARIASVGQGEDEVELVAGNASTLSRSRARGQAGWYPVSDRGGGRPIQSVTRSRRHVTVSPRASIL